MKEIALKWYKKLGFPATWDAEFYNILNNFDGKEVLHVTDFDIKKHTPQEALIYFLYFCEELEVKYKERGIGEDILFDTLSDILVWVNTYKSIYKKLGLEECDWLKVHLSFNLFKLGRLQFRMGTFKEDYPKINAKLGDNVMEIHIPETGKLDIEDCIKSIERAKGFFAKYFPEFNYEYFSCNSWLLDRGLLEMLNEQSNILKFSSLFEYLSQVESDGALRYIFRWDATRENLDKFEAKSTLAKKAKEKVINGGKFYRGFGVIKK